MRPRHLVFESHLAASQEQVFAFHERADAFTLLTPWWSGGRVVRAAHSLRPGERAVLRLGCGPFGREWEAVHESYDPPRSFVEYQLRGPFRAWRHRHRILADGTGACLRDELEYELPGGWLAPLLDRLLQPFLRLLFAYRHAVTRRYVLDAPASTCSNSPARRCA